MAILISKERFKLYVKIGAFYIALWMFHDLVKEPERFFLESINDYATERIFY
jgi:hypothetical protein